LAALSRGTTNTFGTRESYGAAGATGSAIRMRNQHSPGTAGKELMATSCNDISKAGRVRILSVRTGDSVDEPLIRFY